MRSWRSGFGEHRKRGNEEQPHDEDAFHGTLERLKKWLEDLAEDHAEALKDIFEACFGRLFEDEPTETPRSPEPEDPKSTFECSPGDDEIVGTDGNDVIKGCHGNDSLIGARGDDVLRGGHGNDYLSGNQGKDTMFGGAGADVFVFDGDFDQDRVKDFSVLEDRMQFIFYTDERSDWTAETLTGFCEQVEEDVVMTLPDRDEMITFVDVSLADLDPASIEVIQYVELIA